jgi:hypothetical protein
MSIVKNRRKTARRKAAHKAKNRMRVNRMASKVHKKRNGRLSRT